MSLKTILKNPMLNGWKLFWLISVPMSLLVVGRAMGVDLGTPAGISSMISFSVRLAVPFLFIVVITQRTDCRMES